MAILIDKTTRVLVQGITGKQGAAATREMLAYGTKVVCGVTPGKGGQQVEGVPVYNTIREALTRHAIDASVVYVPPLLAKHAICEAIDALIPLIVVITEGVPLHDIAAVIAHARRNNVRLVGPGSVGIISPGEAKLGSVGGVDRAFLRGNIGIISKSGGMTSETALLLTKQGLGQSTALCIGGERLLGTTFADALALFEHDEETHAIVMFGEIGGQYEQEMADAVATKRCTKPVVAFISGAFASMLPEVALGHAGAIIEGEASTRAAKVKYLRERGVAIAEVHHEMVNLVREALIRYGMENTHLKVE